jgi:hypothetical protein
MSIENFSDEKTFQKAQNVIIWHTDTQHPPEHLFHHTWLISADKAEELENTIVREMGSDVESEKTAIAYFNYGETSLLRKEKATEAFKSCFRFLTTIGGIATGIYIGYKGSKAFSEALLRNNPYPIPRNNLEELWIKFDYLVGGTAFTAITSYYSAISTGVIAYEITEKAAPAIEVPKMHNCSSWAMEKLHNLNIPEINKVIEPTLFVTIIDKIAYLASAHVDSNDELCEAAQFYRGFTREILYNVAPPLQKVDEEVVQPTTQAIHQGIDHGLVVGGTTGMAIGATVATTCLSNPKNKAVAVVTCEVIGASVMATGLDNIINAPNDLTNKFKEKWVDMTNTRILDQPRAYQ